MLQAFGHYQNNCGYPGLRKTRGPPPTTPFISFSLRLATLKSKLPHLERNDSAGEARQTLDEAQNNGGRTMAILSTVTCALYSSLLFTYRQKHFIRARLEMFSSGSVMRG